MLSFKYLLLTIGIALFLSSVAVLAYDAWLCFRSRRGASGRSDLRPPKPVRWRMTLGLLSLAWAPMLVFLSLLMTPLNSAANHPACVPQQVQSEAVHQEVVRADRPGSTAGASQHGSPSPEGR